MNTMDKFDMFLQNMDELLANQPTKCIDWQVGYWAAIHAVRNAAHTAKATVEPDYPCDNGHNWVYHIPGWIICTKCHAEEEGTAPKGESNETLSRHD
jgi:hypothetical protein